MLAYECPLKLPPVLTEIQIFVRAKVLDVSPRTELASNWSSYSVTETSRAH